MLVCIKVARWCSSRISIWKWGQSPMQSMQSDCRSSLLTFTVCATYQFIVSHLQIQSPSPCFATGPLTKHFSFVAGLVLGCVRRGVKVTLQGHSGRRASFPVPAVLISSRLVLEMPCSTQQPSQTAIWSSPYPVTPSNTFPSPPGHRPGPALIISSGKHLCLQQAVWPMELCQLWRGLDLCIRVEKRLA
jgi:hypothetical protein